MFYLNLIKCYQMLHYDIFLLSSYMYVYFKA